LVVFITLSHFVVVIFCNVTLAETSL
jgi:hypothetical protein